MLAEASQSSIKTIRRFDHDLVREGTLGLRRRKNLTSSCLRRWRRDPLELIDEVPERCGSSSIELLGRHFLADIDWLTAYGSSTLGRLLVDLGLSHHSSLMFLVRYQGSSPLILILTVILGCSTVSWHLHYEAIGHSWRCC